MVFGLAHANELKASVFLGHSNADDVRTIDLTKLAGCFVGPIDNARMPNAVVATQINCKSEHADVIGRDLSPGREMGNVCGYKVLNDVTKRFVQKRFKHSDLGQGFVRFCPMRPKITTADEADLHNSRGCGSVTLSVASPSCDKTATFATRSSISRRSSKPALAASRLLPDDVTTTGAPAGVVMGFKYQRWLAAGDVVRIGIDDIGAIGNRFLWL